MQSSQDREGDGLATIVTDAVLRSYAIGSGILQGNMRSRAYVGHRGDVWTPQHSWITSRLVLPLQQLRNEKEHWAAPSSRGVRGSTRPDSKSDINRGELERMSARTDERATFARCSFQAWRGPLHAVRSGVKNGLKVLAWSSTLPHFHQESRLRKSFSGGLVFGGL